jgi:hypothetical protein
MKKEATIRGVKWDVISPRSIMPASPTKSEFCTQSPPLFGGMIGGWPDGMFPPGRNHMATTLQSLSRQFLSFHLGNQCRDEGGVDRDNIL